MTNKKNRSGTEKAGDMNSIAKTLFAPVYPMIAKQAIQRFGITTGTCIDLGSGPASLSIAIANASDLQVIALDLSEEMQDVADEKHQKCRFNRQNSPHERRCPCNSASG